MKFVFEIYWVLNSLIFLEIFSTNASCFSSTLFKNSFNQLSNNSLNHQLVNNGNPITFPTEIIPPLKRSLRKRNIFSQTSNNFLDECCETVVEVYKPLGGVSKSSKLLILYRDENLVQTFYQLSCKKEIINKPCKYLDKQYALRSICTQRYSYTLALVREPNASENVSYYLDYIRIKNGCSCMVAN